MSVESTAAVVVTTVITEVAAQKDFATFEAENKTNGSENLKEVKGVRKGKGRGKGRGNGKIKGKGKGSGKGKGKRGAHAKAKASARARAHAPEKVSSENAEPENGAALDRAAKIPKLSLRSQVTSSILNRDIEEVMAEAKAEVHGMQESIEKAAAEERSIEEQLKILSKALAEASARVEQGVKQEELALDKLRKARESQIEATLATTEARLNQDNVMKQMRTLELEVHARQQVVEYEEAKQAAREAAEAAKKALQEAKMREKEAGEAMRKAMKEQRAKAPAAIMDRVEGQEDDNDEDIMSGGKDAVSSRKETIKASAIEIKAIEKMRLEREKRREASLKEASGACRRTGRGAAKGPGRAALAKCPSAEAVEEADVVDAVDVR